MAVEVALLEKQLKAVANRRRLAVLAFLNKKKGRKCVGEIAAHIQLSLRSTSRHLSILYARNLLKKEQEGLSVYYTISEKLPAIIQEVLNEI